MGKDLRGSEFKQYKKSEVSFLSPRHSPLSPAPQVTSDSCGSLQGLLPNTEANAHVPSLTSALVTRPRHWFCPVMTCLGECFTSVHRSPLMFFTAVWYLVELLCMTDSACIVDAWAFLSVRMKLASFASLDIVGLLHVCERVQGKCLEVGLLGSGLCSQFCDTSPVCPPQRLDNLLSSQLRGKVPCRAS